MKRAFLCLIAVLIVTFPNAAYAGKSTAPWHAPLPSGRQTAPITIGDTPLTVDLALTGQEQQLGLGYRNGLEPGTGMLFVFPDKAPLTFWMKGMRFCLDIIWIADGKVVGAAENACPDPAKTPDEARPRYSSGDPAQYVLEVPAGFMKTHGYGKGTPVDVSKVPPATSN